MSEFVRVRDKSTGHEYTVRAELVHPEGHEVLDKPAVGRDRLPLPVKYRTRLLTPRRTSRAPKPVPAVSDAPATNDGQKADSEKEND